MNVVAMRCALMAALVLAEKEWVTWVKMSASG